MPGFRNGEEFFSVECVSNGKSSHYPRLPVEKQYSIN